MELAVVVAIIAVLSSIGILYFNDLMHASRDSAAFTDAKNFLTVASEKFVARESVNFDTVDGTGNVGTEDQYGNTIDPVFRTSPGVRVKFEPGNNMSYEDAQRGTLTAYFWNPTGTEVPAALDLSGANEGRRVAQVLIHEDEFNTGSDIVQDIILW